METAVAILCEGSPFDTLIRSALLPQRTGIL